MVIHGRLALPHESRTIHHFLARRRRGQLLASTSYTCSAGVLLGVLAPVVNLTVVAGENLTVGSATWLPAASVAPGR